jgi:hypothetical protein
MSNNRNSIFSLILDNFDYNINLIGIVLCLIVIMVGLFIIFTYSNLTTSFGGMLATTIWGVSIITIIFVLLFVLNLSVSPLYNIIIDHNDSVTVEYSIKCWILLIAVSLGIASITYRSYPKKYVWNDNDNDSEINKDIYNPYNEGYYISDLDDDEKKAYVRYYKALDAKDKTDKEEYIKIRSISEAFCTWFASAFIVFSIASLLIAEKLRPLIRPFNKDNEYFDILSKEGIMHLFILLILTVFSACNPTPTLMVLYTTLAFYNKWVWWPQMSSHTKYVKYAIFYYLWDCIKWTFAITTLWSIILWSIGYFVLNTEKKLRAFFEGFRLPMLYTKLESLFTKVTWIESLGNNCLIKLSPMMPLWPFVPINIAQGAFSKVNKEPWWQFLPKLFIYNLFISNLFGLLGFVPWMLFPLLVLPSVPNKREIGITWIIAVFLLPVLMYFIIDGLSNPAFLKKSDDSEENPPNSNPDDSEENPPNSNPDDSEENPPNSNPDDSEENPPNSNPDDSEANPPNSNPDDSEANPPNHKSTTSSLEPESEPSP